MRVSTILLLAATFLVGTLPASSAMARESCIFASADWINWKARRGDMDFVIVDANIDTDPQGTELNLNYDGHSGARVAVGCHFDSDWDLSVEYQTYKTDDHLSIIQPVGGTLWATRTHPDSVVGSTDATSAEAWASLDYNVIDLMLSRRFSADRCQQLGVTLFGGFRYAQINQNLNITYLDSVNNEGADIDNPMHLDGYGIRLGGTLTGRFTKVSGSLDKVPLSALAAKSNIRFTETDVTGTGTTYPVDVSNESYKAVPVIETSLGMAYQRGCWEVAGGYEMAMWETSASGAITATT